MLDKFYASQEPIIVALLLLPQLGSFLEEFPYILSVFRPSLFINAKSQSLVNLLKFNLNLDKI